MSVVIYDSAIDIALRLKWKILCFPQRLSHGLQWVMQSALHCTTEAMTIHNNQSSIKRIYMTLKCMCVFLLFPFCFFSWRPIKNDTVTPYILFDKKSVTLYVFFHDDQRKTTVLPLMFFFMTTNKKQQCYPLCFFSWWQIKNNNPYVFFMTTDRKRQCYPLYFIWQRH